MQRSLSLVSSDIGRRQTGSGENCPGGAFPYIAAMNSGPEDGYSGRTTNLDWCSEREAHQKRKGTILSLAGDEILLSTRQMVLETAGYTVHSVPPGVMPGDGQISAVDMAIICHTVAGTPAGDAILRLRKEKPNIPILRLMAFNEEEHPLDNYVVLWFPTHPRQLLAQVDKMLSSLQKMADGRPSTTKLP